MDFQSEKSFGKLRLRAFQPYHQILCMLKHVEDVEDYTYIALQPLGVLDLSSTSSTYIALQPLGIFDLSSTSLTYIALQPLGVLYLSSTSSTLTHIDMRPLMYTQQIR